MAAPAASQRVVDIQRRAAEKPEVAFKAFDTYPWQADQLFNVSGPCEYQLPSIDTPVTNTNAK